MHVMHRQQEANVSSSSQWALLTWRERWDVLDEVIVSTILEWWKNETRMNLNRTDVIKQCIALKVYEKHITHLLLEDSGTKLNYD